MHSSTTIPDRCPLCCAHGVLYTQWCGWCEDLNEGYYDCYIPNEQPMWECSHGIGEKI